MDQIPLRVSAPVAIARELPDFGVVDGPIGAEYFTLNAGIDRATLLAWLDDVSCHYPQWGYVITGTSSSRTTTEPASGAPLETALTGHQATASG